MSQETQRNADSDPGRSTGRSPSPLPFYFWLVREFGFCCRSPACLASPPAGRDKGDASPGLPCEGQSWKQPKLQRPGSGEGTTAGLNPGLHTHPHRSAQRNGRQVPGSCPKGTRKCFHDLGQKDFSSLWTWCPRASGEDCPSPSQRAETGSARSEETPQLRPRSPAHTARSSTALVPTRSRPSSGR